MDESLTHCKCIVSLRTDHSPTWSHHYHWGHYMLSSLSLSQFTLTDAALVAVDVSVLREDEDRERESSGEDGFDS